MPGLDKNMEDLFRRAGDDYPLNAGEDNWSRVASKLEDNKASLPERKKNHRKLYTVLFLFLFLSLGELFLLIMGNRNETIQPGESSTISDAKIRIEELPNEKNITAFNKRKEILEVQPSLNLTRKGKIGAGPFTYRDKSGEPGNIDLLNNNPENFSSTPDFKNVFIERVATRLVSPEPMVFKLDDKNPNFSATKETISLGRQPRFYFGLVAGPAFNEVKRQGLRQPGFAGGILAGYKINKKVSVETGLLFSKKNYYSDGKYFDLGKMPSGMEVLSLEGRSAIFELPIRARYNFVSGTRANSFLSAGISSYILANEKNDYQISMNGINQDMTGNYRNVSGYFAATFNISIGFERKIGKSSQIRLEPYLQVPLRGIGVGYMPVMSTGLQIGFTRSAQH